MKKLFNLKKENRHELYTYKYPKSTLAEAYRTLRTNLGFACVDDECRSILFTSPNPGDGKSTVASNLAVVMAQAGNRVALVDADLRKPMQHTIFEVDNRQGLTSVLLRETETKKVMHNGLVENLHVMTSGPIPPNPAEILSSARTRQLLEQLLAEYDYVFIDAPPLLAVTDASLLSTIVDGVVLVVAYAATRNDLARESVEQLRKANARIIGVVLNQVKVESGDYKYYYYYYSHSDEAHKTN
ncbi:MAG TPA: CpsD/CapB family tyrosine-protein kinase [Syntrophomonas sp.]|nr:CpsD/CapB family tyrosine-protein kinase [Syntrophomonas sp.]